MATSVLPSRPDLEQYKKQARELLKSIQSGNAESVERLRHSAAHIDPRNARLADAQLVIAREHGFASWPKFKLHVETANGDFAAKANAFVDAAIGNRLGAARQIVTEAPGVERANIYTASAYGDVETVRRFLDSAPALVNKPGGPRNRVPLLYACFSHFIRDREAAILDTVRLLLDHGADPNATYVDQSWSLPALYGACGVLGNPRLAAILIDAGANVDDNESLYHSTEFRDGACTRLLLERGARVNGTNALKHMLDHDDLDGLRLLLDYGADPNEPNENGETALHWALFRHRALPFFELLVERGANVDAHRKDGLTTYRMASRLGRADVADFLRRAGADTTLTDEDRRVMAAISGKGGGEKVNDDELLGPVLVTAAELGDVVVLANLLDLGVSPDSRGTHRATALHWAAWKGHPEAVRLLIERGATIEIEGADLGSTPLQWAFHASTNNGGMTPEHALAVVNVLLDAGAVPHTLEMASDEVRAHVEERLRGR
jgi:ankyrin repeat protein